MENTNCNMVTVTNGTDGWLMRPGWLLWLELRMDSCRIENGDWSKFHNWKNNTSINPLL
jgi:hypothetical protein